MFTSVKLLCQIRSVQKLEMRYFACVARRDHVGGMVERAGEYDALSCREPITRVREMAQDMAELLWMSAAEALGQPWPASVVGFPDEDDVWEVKQLARVRVQDSLAASLVALAKVRGSMQALDDPGEDEWDPAATKVASRLMEIERMLGVGTCIS